MKGSGSKDGEEEVSLSYWKDRSQHLSVLGGVSVRVQSEKQNYIKRDLLNGFKLSNCGSWLSSLYKVVMFESDARTSV